MIETKRLQLRKMIPEDIDALLSVFGDPKVMASFGAIAFTREQMAAWVGRNLRHQEEYGYGLFSVILKSEDKLVGDCGLEQVDINGEHLVELGYDFSSQHWGQGFATEAACAVRDFAFGTLGLDRLVSLIRVANVASKRVSEKVGMRLYRKLVRHGHGYLLYSIDREKGQPTLTPDVSSSRR